MANSAITDFRLLLKEIANGLTEKDTQEIMFMMTEFSAATRAEIKSGTKLLQEMEQLDLLDEDNLETLKGVLEKQKLMKLLKMVKKFEERITSDKKGQAEMMHLGNQYPGGGYPMQGCNQPGQMLTHQQYPQTSYPYQHGMGAPGYGSQGFQQQIPNEQQVFQRQEQVWLQQQEQVWLQQQHQLMNSHPIPPPHYQDTGTHVPGTNSQPNRGAQQIRNMHSRVLSYPQASGDPMMQGYASVPGHTKLSATKSAPSYRTSVRGDLEKLSLTAEPEVGLKGIQQGGLNVAPTSEPTVTAGGKAMNIPLGNVDEVVGKATGLQTEKGNIMDVTSSTGGCSFSNEKPTCTTECRKDATIDTYQTGRVRAESVENNNVDSVAIATQPLSSKMQSEIDPELLLLSGFVGKQLYDRKVDQFENGSYQVRIPQGSHYSTSEGAFVVIRFNSDYKIQLCNNNECLRCSAVVHYNGKFAGDWTLDPKSTITIERPAIEEMKFHFVEASRAPPGSGVRDGDPDNGFIKVVFTPEQSEMGSWNDLSRGFGNFGSEPETDYFGTDDTTGNGINRSILPPPASDWRVGATVLHGQSSQQFTASEHFQLDKHGEKKIVLKLVGK